MVVLCFKLGKENFEVRFEGGSFYQLKSAIKSENNNEYRNTDTRQIVVRDFNHNEVANLDELERLIAAGHGKDDMPFLVDASAGMSASSNFRFCPTQS
jgi:hypothetical protein